MSLTTADCGSSRALAGAGSAILALCMHGSSFQVLQRMEPSATACGANLSPSRPQVASAGGRGKMIIVSDLQPALTQPRTAGATRPPTLRDIWRGDSGSEERIAHCSCEAFQRESGSRRQQGAAGRQPTVL